MAAAACRRPADAAAGGCRSWCARRPPRSKRALPSGEPPPAPATARPRGGEDDDENALSLSALEEKLKPEVLRSLTKIATSLYRDVEGAEPRLSTLERGQKPSPEFEKSYEKHRKKIVELVRDGAHQRHPHRAAQALRSTTSTAG